MTCDKKSNFFLFLNLGAVPRNSAWNFHPPETFAKVAATFEKLCAFILIVTFTLRKLPIIVDLPAGALLFELCGTTKLQTRKLN